MAPVPALFDGIGFSEMLVIGFLAILVFGGNLPDALRNLGRQYAKFRKNLSDVSRPLRDEIQKATTLPADLYTPAPPTSSARLGSGPGAPTPAQDLPPPEPPGHLGTVPPAPAPPSSGGGAGTPPPTHAFPAAFPAGSGAPEPFDEEPPPV